LSWLQRALADGGAQADGRDLEQIGGQRLMAMHGAYNTLNWRPQRARADHGVICYGCLGRKVLLYEKLSKNITTMISGAA